MGGMSQTGKHKDKIEYRGHEWRERLPVGKAGYVCAECAAVAANVTEMQELSGTCKSRLVDKSWAPQPDESKGLV